MTTPDQKLELNVDLNRPGGWPKMLIPSPKRG